MSKYLKSHTTREASSRFGISPACASRWRNYSEKNCFVRIQKIPKSSYCDKTEDIVIKPPTSVNIVTFQDEEVSHIENISDLLVNKIIDEILSEVISLSSDTEIPRKKGYYYDEKFKMKVVEYSKTHSIKRTAERFKVSESSCKLWKKSVK